MWDAVTIVTLDQAKRHMNQPLPETLDEDYELKVRQAHAIVLDYVANNKADAYIADMLTWTIETAPAAVQAAIFRQFADLVSFRGDDDKQRDDLGLSVSPRVKQLLRMHITPALA
jgi:hypothetical protein